MSNSRLLSLLSVALLLSCAGNTLFAMDDGNSGNNGNKKNKSKFDQSQNLHNQASKQHKTTTQQLNAQHKTITQQLNAQHKMTTQQLNEILENQKGNTGNQVDLSSSESEDNDKETINPPAGWAAADQRQTNLRAAFLVYVIAKGVNFSAQLRTEDPEDSRFCTFFSDVENAALLTTCTQGVRSSIDNDDWKTLSTRICQFESGSLKELHRSEATVETLGFVGNNVLVNQIRHVDWFKQMCEKIGIDEWPEPVQKKID